MPAMIHLYVEDCDETYERALAAGATSEREPTDQFYGDRSAGVRDSAGNLWWIATHVEDVSEEEMAKRMEAATAAQAN
jgi:PhnB protein